MNITTQANAAAYDTHAQAWYEHTKRNEKYRFLEKPAMETLLPSDLSGKNVLCIGVGSGEELGTLLARNPRHIVAIDISQRLLDITHEQYPEVECMCVDMMELADRVDTLFDLVYSSLAFHYTRDWDALLAGVHRVLRPGGTLLFSTHHPGYWAKNPTGASHTNKRGVKLTEHTATLPGGVGITYYNHTSTDALQEALHHTGFTVERAFAPDVVSVPPHTLTPALRKRYENLVRTNQETPLFWVVGARKA